MQVNKMNILLKKDKEQLDLLLTKIKEQAVDYLKNITTRPTSTENTVVQKKQLAEKGLGSKAALDQFNERFEPMMIASSGPRYLGFVTGGSTPASIMGDWLTSIYDQNTQTTKGQGDVSANIELETIQLLLDLFKLPRDYFGGFVSGATMSNFTCLAVARQWLGKQIGIDFAKEGINQKIKVFTATAHSSALKALSLLGIGSNNIIKIKKLAGNREAVDMEALEKELKALNGEPCIFIASGGTVNTVDFDDFIALKELKNTYRFWCHIDAAFGGFAACTDTHSNLLQGWECADSITIDCHKWLNVPYESAVFFIKEVYNILQVETFQNSNAPYLGDPMEHFNYLNFLPENSRRLKALPVWFSLLAYGKKGIKDIVENNITLAQYFGKYIAGNKEFELLAPVRLNTVCFTLSGEKNQGKVALFLKQLNNTGLVFMTPTIYNEQKGIRAAFVNWLTQKEDIEIIIEQMNNTVRTI
jgi:glutamate/tyrosine decarboxylase-like PLP-dependent enzyme